MATSQRNRVDGGLAVPDCKLYCWSFVLRPLLVWFNPHISVSWRKIEEHIVRPWNLEDILFSNVSDKQCRLRFGPIVSHLIKTWRLVESRCKVSCKWHKQSPIFNNKGLTIGGRPIPPSHWSRSAIRHLEDIYNDSGLCSFQDIANSFNLPASSFFFYLPLRSALKAYGVPWQQPLLVHPLYKLIIAHGNNRGLVSILYNFILEASYLYAKLPLDRLRRRDCPSLDPEFTWEDVWVNIKEASHNPDHQQIHFNFVHRTYLTPRKLHLMKRLTDPTCTQCVLKVPGTFLHMMWECPPVAQFWTQVASRLSDLVSATTPVTVPVLLLNNLTMLNLNNQHKCTVLAGLTCC